MKASVIRSSLCAPFLAVIFFCSTIAIAEENPPPEIPIQQWLDAPDRRDFDWKVTVEPPRLTFQQRHLQTIQTTLSVGRLLKAGVPLTDLHFVVKFAGADGNWFAGQCYSHFVPTPDLRAGDQIHSFASVYLRPGKYKVGVMAYDSLHQRGNLWRGRFEVPPVKSDPLPEMDRDLPETDILPNVQHPFIKLPYALSFADPWALGEGTLGLPVDNKTPVQLDVVTNLSWNAGLLLQMSSVLSQLSPKNGCVRFSAVDVLRRKTYLPHEEASRVDWRNLQKVLEESWNEAFVKGQTVDVGELATPKPGPEVYARFLENVLRDTSTCIVQSQPFRRILIVVSDASRFSSDLKADAVRPQSLNIAECYHLELDQSAGGPRRDQTVFLLKSLNPRQFRFSNPLQFRKTLSQLIYNIENPSTGTLVPRASGKAPFLE